MKITWADSPHLDQIYLEIAVNDGLGALVIQDRKEDEPQIVFCSLFEDSAKVFYEGLDKRAVGMPIGDLRRMLDEIESIMKARPFK